MIGLNLWIVISTIKLFKKIGEFLKILLVVGQNAVVRNKVSTTQKQLMAAYKSGMILVYNKNIKCWNFREMLIVLCLQLVLKDGLRSWIKSHYKIGPSIHYHKILRLQGFGKNMSIWHLQQSTEQATWFQEKDLKQLFMWSQSLWQAKTYE